MTDGHLEIGALAALELTKCAVLYSNFCCTGTVRVDYSVHLKLVLFL